MNCEYLSGCPIFNEFKVEGLSNVWIRLYCKGEKCSECARRKLRTSGKEVPRNLLPNGNSLIA